MYPKFQFKRSCYDFEVSLRTAPQDLSDEEEEEEEEIENPEEENSSPTLKRLLNKTDVVSEDVAENDEIIVEKNVAPSGTNAKKRKPPNPTKEGTKRKKTAQVIFSKNKN